MLLQTLLGVPGMLKVMEALLSQAPGLSAADALRSTGLADMPYSAGLLAIARHIKLTRSC